MAEALKGKVAIVTGGNTGIGAAVVLALADQGAKVVIDYVANDPDATEELERKLHALGDTAVGVEADVSKVEDIQRMIDTAVSNFGRLDVMVNNAGHRDPDLGPGHDRRSVREGHGGESEERLLRHPAGRQADDRPGRRRPHHQHDLGPRGLADARATPPTASPRAVCAC